MAPPPARHRHPDPQQLMADPVHLGARHRRGEAQKVSAGGHGPVLVEHRRRDVRHLVAATGLDLGEHGVEATRGRPRSPRSSWRALSERGCSCRSRNARRMRRRSTVCSPVETRECANRFEDRAAARWTPCRPPVIAASTPRPGLGRERGEDRVQRGHDPDPLPYRRHHAVGSAGPDALEDDQLVGRRPDHQPFEAQLVGEHRELIARVRRPPDGAPARRGRWGSATGRARTSCGLGGAPGTRHRSWRPAPRGPRPG